MNNEPNTPTGPTPNIKKHLEQQLRNQAAGGNGGRAGAPEATGEVFRLFVFYLNHVLMGSLFGLLIL